MSALPPPFEMPLATHETIWTSWKLLYTVLFTVWTCMVCINYVATEDELNLVQQAAAAAADAGTWVPVAGVMGVSCGAVMFLCIMYGALWDPGRWETIGNLKPQIARVLLQVAHEIGCLCTITVASIYFYLHQGNVVSNLSGAPWVVVIGAVTFGAILVDRIVFHPTTLYIEVLSSPCLARFSSNTVLSYGNTLRQRSAYRQYFDRLFPQLPKLNMLYSKLSLCNGIPLIDLCNSSRAAGCDDDYADAARALILRLQANYDLGSV